MGRYNFNQRTRDGYEISPEQAAKWLERNDNNRNVNVAKVKKMAKDMREGHWDTRSIEDMSGMFECCAGISNLHFLKTWNTSNTLYTGGMFYMDRSNLQWTHSQLTSLEGLEDWEVSNVISMYNMFGDCENLRNCGKNSPSFMWGMNCRFTV